MRPDQDKCTQKNAPCVEVDTERCPGDGLVEVGIARNTRSKSDPRTTLSASGDSLEDDVGALAAELESDRLEVGPCRSRHDRAANGG